MKRNDAINCMFLGCDFKTNIYCTFKSLKNQKHCHHTLADFKPGVVLTRISSFDEVEEICQVSVEQSDTDIPSNSQSHTEDLQKILEQSFAALLKLEHLVHVPSTAIDDFF